MIGLESVPVTTSDLSCFQSRITVTVPTRPKASNPFAEEVDRHPQDSYSQDIYIHGTERYRKHKGWMCLISIERFTPYRMYIIRNVMAGAEMFFRSSDLNIPTTTLVLQMRNHQILSILLKPFQWVSKNGWVGYSDWQLRPWDELKPQVPKTKMSRHFSCWFLSLLVTLQEDICQWWWRGPV